MPALRTEEVFWAHAQVFAAIGHTGEAALWRDRADKVVMDKASTIGSPDDRQAFLSRVPVNREILLNGQAS
ncbi:hypothetical protein [Microtetraspora fusca]|uniref:hypothetical protein n=1 Tax=Microtetraspora fusca TaxID=1997 RepID=UPI00082BE289|nr:hypothetical protein [Microtetraspora fusca]